MEVHQVAPLELKIDMEALKMLIGCGLRAVATGTLKR
jgi:hypothetical protein